MKNYGDFDTLLQEMKNDIITVDGIIQKNAKRYVISRKVNGAFENITLSQYKNSEDLILVETKEHSFTVTRWDADFTISQQITQNTEEYIDPIRQAHIDYENEKYERLYNSDAWVDAQRNS